MSVSPDRLQEWIVAWIRTRIGDPTAAIDLSAEVTRYGLDSVALVALAGELGARVGRPLPATFAWEFPSVEELARAAAGGAPPPLRSREPGAGGALPGPAEPIAIIGIGCRLPGAEDKAAFWRLLRDGLDAVRELPPERASEFRDVDPGIDALLTTGRAGYLAAVDRFDPTFFGIAPREADRMDPQQRLLLEVAWEAIEDAGIPPSSLRTSATGVYAGACWADYLALASRRGLRVVSPHSATGVHFSIVANRVSYLLGLQGPSLAVDAACASSLVAIHLACQALRLGECTLALAGGVNVIAGPDSTVAMSRLGALAPDGRSKAFDASADGYGRGEGAAIVVLKRLARALVDGDRVYALIRGSAVNNDGPSNGLTAPNQRAQEAVIRAALGRAGVAAADVAYVETHGTGTPLGDPIEARALGAVFAAGRPPERALRIGSVKTNIGHVESGAGVAGLVKVALALSEGTLPPSLLFTTPTPDIDFDGLGLTVQHEAGPWPPGRRLAGVSSFGFGGTNAHAVLEARPAIEPLPEPPPAAGRARVVFVCSGYGGHWTGMARSLLAAEPEFAAAVRRCDRRLRALGGPSVLEALASDRLDTRVDVLQPTLFAIQIGLIEWLAARGVRPDAVIGHSFGEVAAAHAAGMLGFDDAVMVILHYTRLQAETAGAWGMAMVAAGTDAVRELAPEVWIAAVNAPEISVAAGPLGAVETLVEAAAARGVFARRLEIDVAAHGPAIEPIRALLDAALEHVRHLRPAIPFFSTALGAWIDRPPGPGYWSVNLSRPVRFFEAVRAAASHDAIWVELGPHPVLERGITQTLGGASVLACGRRGADERAVLADTLAALAGHGVPVHPPQEGGPVALAASARSDEALRARVAQLEAALDGAAAHDVAWTTTVRSEHHDRRVVVVGRSAPELRERLRSWLEGAPTRGLAAGVRKRGAGPVFVFAGQGGQWPGMARRLLDVEPTFGDALRACDQALETETGWSALAELAAPPERSRLGDIDVLQPVLFAVQVSLAALLRAWGIEPSAVVGHSMGEVAAACVAGALSLEDAARVITRRSRLLVRARGQGAMALLDATLEEAAARIAGQERHLSIAAANGPRVTLVSGDAGAVDALVERLGTEGIFARTVKAAVASHGPQMDPLLDELRAALAGIVPREPGLPFHSTVEGAGARAPVPDAGYWARNLRQPVLFAPVVGELAGAGARHFVEVGPHPVLLGPITQVLADRGVDGVALATCRRDEDDAETLLEAAAALHVDGVEVDWDRIVRRGGRLVSLPPYPWQRQRCWLEGKSAAPAGDWREAPVQSSVEPDRRYREATIGRGAPSWLADHRVRGSVVVPATAWLALVDDAPEAPLRLEEVRFERLLVVGDATWRVQCAGVGESFTISSRPEGAHDAAWTRHVRGRVRPLAAPPEAPDLERLRAVLPERPLGEHFGAMERLGISYGAAFRGLERWWGGSEEALGRARLPWLDADVYRLHPCLLDACLQLFVAACADAISPGASLVVAAIESVDLIRPARGEAWCHVRRSAPLVCDADLFDAGGVVARFRGIAGRELRDDGSARPLFEIAWIDRPLPPARRQFVPGSVVTEEGRHVIARVDAGDASEAVGAACLRVVELARQLAARPRPPRLWLITEGATEGDACGAAVWGLAEAIRRELPELRCTTIDAPDGTDLAAELEADGAELRVQLGPAGRRVARLATAPGPEGDFVPRSAASYLVTGGFGGLGSAVVAWLLDRGARHVVVLGRGLPPAGLDPRIVAVRGDVAEPADAARAVAAADALAPLAGVVHAAGVLADGLLGDLDASRFAAVFRPKLAGAWNLDRATAKHELDFFVLYGSVASMLGLQGQGNYCAANASLEAVAARRRAAGLPGLAVSWGLFTGGGLADRSGAVERLAGEGFAPMSPAEGAAWLGRILPDAGRRTHVGAFGLDFERWFAAHPAFADDPLFEGFTTAAAAGRPAILEELAASPGAARPPALAAWLRTQVGEVLRLPPGRVPGDAALTALGLDSMMAVELRERVRRALGVHLPLLDFFGGATVESLVGGLLDRIGPSGDDGEREEVIL